MGSKNYLLLTACFLAVTLLPGCGDGGGTVATPEDVQTGSFVDSPVCGLQYSTPSWSGETGPDGEFNYQEGELVTFRIGGVVLGTAPADMFVTPRDLAPNPTNPEDPYTANICCLLQSLDKDGDPENGITICPDLCDVMEGFQIDFTDPEFEQNPEVVRLFDEINALGIFPVERALVPASVALIHFEETLLEIEEILAEQAVLDARIVRPKGNALLVGGQSIELEGRVTGGAPDRTCVWDVGDQAGFSLEEDPGMVSFYTKGNFPVLFTVTDADGNTASDSRLVTVVSLERFGEIPVEDEMACARFTTSEHITAHVNEEVSVTVEITKGNPPFFYYWSYPETAEYSYADNPLEATFRFGSPGRHTVSFMVFDSWNQDYWPCSTTVDVDE